MNGASGTRHEWARPGSIALVFAGGCIGAAARETLSAVTPTAAVPFAILVANLLGALLLGAVLEALGRRSTRQASARSLASAARLRLLLGTGALGGFTTYSALAFAVAALLHDGRPWLALGYGLGTLVLGAAATATGIAISARLHAHRRSAERGADA